MNKIFRYEIKRLMQNRIFFGLLAVSLLYGLGILTGEVLTGIADTAPFSPWSFGYYLSRLLPAVCAAELFFLSFFYSDKEKQVRALTQSIIIDPAGYALVRCYAVIAATGFVTVCVIALWLCLYGSFFGYGNTADLILPTLLTLPPAILFCLGAGRLLSSFWSFSPYALMGAVFLVSYMPSPWTPDFSMGSFFAEYPLTLDALDPEFCVPISVLCERIFYLTMGVLMLIWSFCRQKPSRYPIRFQHNLY